MVHSVTEIPITYAGILIRYAGQQMPHLWAAVVLYSRPIGVRILCSYVVLLSKGNGRDGELYLEDFLSQASLMTTAFSFESLRLAAAASFCLNRSMLVQSVTFVSCELTCLLQDGFSHLSVRSHRRMGELLQSRLLQGALTCYALHEMLQKVYTMASCNSIQRQQRKR